MMEREKQMLLERDQYIENVLDGYANDTIYRARDIVNAILESTNNVGRARAELKRLTKWSRGGTTSTGKVLFEIAEKVLEARVAKMTLSPMEEE